MAKWRRKTLGFPFDPEQDMDVQWEEEPSSGDYDSSDVHSEVLGDTSEDEETSEGEEDVDEEAETVELNLQSGVNGNTVPCNELYCYMSVVRFAGEQDVPVQQPVEGHEDVPVEAEAQQPTGEDAEKTTGEDMEVFDEQSYGECAVLHVG